MKRKRRRKCKKKVKSKHTTTARRVKIVYIDFERTHFAVATNVGGQVTFLKPFSSFSVLGWAA